MKNTLLIIMASCLMLLLSCNKDESYQRPLTNFPFCAEEEVSKKFAVMIAAKNSAAEALMAKGGVRPTKPPKGGGGSGGGGGTTNPPPPSKVFTVLLDANGAEVSNTSWNVNGTIYASPATLTQEQLNQIKATVEDDYSPWEVNITFDEAVYAASDPYFRIRCIITNSWEWYGRAGGVAYLGSAFWGDNTPCWVFSGLLGDNAKNVQEAASHEIGHTIGLRHQAKYDESCNKVSDYNSGTGTGAISWAPIMGVGYYSRIVTWYKGPSYGCTNEQDDYTMISSKLPYAVDFDGLTIVGGYVGVLNIAGDIDTHYLNTVVGGTIRVTSENADIMLTVLNANNQIVAQNTNDIDTDASVYVPAGSYRVRIEAVGNANVSNQFMTGRYVVNVN